MGLKDQLASTEESRDNLAKELAILREANEKLPYLESTVVKLNREIEEKNLQIHCHMDDLKEIKDLYRAQLDELVEFQASNTPMKLSDDNSLGPEDSREIDPVGIPKSSNGVYSPRKSATSKVTVTT